MTQLALTDPVTRASAGSAPIDDFTRITTNNGLRKVLRGAIAAFALSDPDADVRLAAVREMLRSLDDDSVAAAARGHRERETNDDVRRAMQEALACRGSRQQRGRQRLAAVQALHDSLSSDVYNRLTSMVTAAEDGSYAEPDVRVRTAAREVV